MTHIGGSADNHETKLIQHLGIFVGVCKKSPHASRLHHPQPARAIQSELHGNEPEEGLVNITKAYSKGSRV